MKKNPILNTKSSENHQQTLERWASFTFDETKGGEGPLKIRIKWVGIEFSASTKLSRSNLALWLGLMVFLFDGCYDLQNIKIAWIFYNCQLTLCEVLINSKKTCPFVEYSTHLFSKSNLFVISYKPIHVYIVPSSSYAYNLNLYRTQQAPGILPLRSSRFSLRFGSIVKLHQQSLVLRTVREMGA